MKNITVAFFALVTLLAPAMAFAAPAGEAAEAAGSNKMFGIALGMGFAIGLAALGGGIGQGRAAAGALEGIARNPNASDKVFTPMLLALAFVESLVIFAFVVAYMISGL
jgi:F-type H+-transporting ATPase subunit c